MDLDAYLNQTHPDPKFISNATIYDKAAGIYKYLMQVPVEYANYDYDARGNIVLLNSQGYPIATVPPNSVLHSPSQFPTNFGSDVEITPVFISNTGTHFLVYYR